MGLADHAFAAAGELADPELQQQLIELTGALAREVRTPVALSH